MSAELASGSGGVLGFGDGDSEGGGVGFGGGSCLGPKEKLRSDGKEGVGGCRSKLRNGLKDICWVPPRASEILVNHIFESLEGARLNI